MFHNLDKLYFHFNLQSIPTSLSYLETIIHTYLNFSIVITVIIKQIIERVAPTKVLTERA